MKYHILLNILDQIRNEAPEQFSTRYRPDQSDIDKLNQARSKAYIHLFLKVSFGLLDFEQREHFVTDGTQDGGIDGYFVNIENKTVYFLQSKFRTTKSNFETKDISLEELLSMDIDRITAGEKCDEYGVEYSGKIKQLQREISQIPDISRYAYRVIIIANLKDIPAHTIKKFCGGYPPEIFDFDKCYQKLVFPVITGTFFNASDLKINIDLSNKNAGSKISYTVKTKISECDTVIGLPANLFFSTGIPVCILVLKKCKKPDDVLFINASEYFEKGKRQNQLTAEHIDKIVTTYQRRKEEDRYSRRVEIDEIKKNEYNLNISRYISTAEAEEEIDLKKVHKDLTTTAEKISATTKEHNKYLKELGLPPLPL